MASQSVDLQQVQAQLFQSFDQIQSLSVEIAAMNAKIDFLNTDRIAKDGQFKELRSANRQLVDSAQVSRSRHQTTKFLNSESPIFTTKFLF